MTQIFLFASLDFHQFSILVEHFIASNSMGGRARPSSRSLASHQCQKGPAASFGDFLVVLWSQQLISSVHFYVAATTQKLIRELMKVDDLTNDEVKSHLHTCLFL